MSTTSSTSSTSSSSSVASFYTTNGTTKLNGSELVSGLDTESLITALTLKTQSKINTQEQLEQKAEWKQTMYQSVQSLMSTFNSTYFSYASSSTNIMSTKFFDSGELTSSSSLVSATGESSAAGNVVIDSISSLATDATLSSSYSPSEMNITSGALRSEWTQSALSGKSLTVTYGGSDYTLTLGSSASLDSSGTTEENLQSIADALNSQISENSSLSGNVQFSVDETSGDSLKLSTTDSASSTSIGIKANSSDSTSSDFLTAIGFTSLPASGTGSLTGSAVTLDSSSVADSSLFSHTVSSSSDLVFSIDGSQYTLTLGSTIDLSGLSDSEAATKIADQLKSQISANSSLSGKVTVSDDGSGNISFSGDGVSITGGSSNLLMGLGLESSVGGTIGTSGTADTTKLTQSYLGDTLAGSTLSVQLNGVSKTISFDSTDESSYSSISGLQSYLQSAMDTAYGSGKVSVDLNSSDQLVFTTADATSILSLSSSSVSDVLSDNGALRIATGETNRLETTKTLNELSSELNNSLTAGSDGKYTINVNGTSFSFTGDTELGTVISTINSSSDADINITYSQTLNRFHISSDDTGSQEQISIQDENGGTLGAILFGTDYSQISAVQSTALTATDGKYSTGSNDSTYTFQLSGGTAQTVTIDKDQTYSSMSAFASAVQSSIDSNSDLDGNITVGVSSDGTKLTFNVSSSEAAGTTLTIASSGTDDDILGIGTSGQTTVDSSQTLETLYNDGVSGITKGTDSDGNTVYTIGSLSFSGDTALSETGYDSYAKGTDLVMSAELGGSSTATTVTRSTNSFTLDGVTLNITGIPDDEVTFTASSDVDDLYSKISDFITSYNDIIDKANTYVTETPYGLSSSNDGTESYEPLTDSQKEEMTSDEITEWNEKAQQGLLENDSTLNSILSDLRSAMETTVSSAGLTLSQIGISTEAYDYTSGGKLVIDETTLKSALQSEPDEISQLFTDTNGIASKVKSVLTNYIGESGNSGILASIAGSSSSTTASSSELDLQISQYEETIKDLKSQLSDEQTYWQTKFTTMETKLSTINSQYTYLSSMLGTSSS